MSTNDKSLEELTARLEQLKAEEQKLAAQAQKAEDKAEELKTQIAKTFIEMATMQKQKVFSPKS